MNVPMGEKLGIQRQRSFWLRCFLSFALSLLGVTVRLATAQLAIEKPLHLSRIRGYVTDQKGSALPDAHIELLRDGKPVLRLAADKTGWFQIDKASGRYVLRVAETSEAGREIAVGTSLSTLFLHNTLYVMVRPNQVCDDCSILIYTSKKQFFNAVWQNTGHY